MSGAWGTIRKATGEDQDRLEAAAERAITRLGIDRAKYEWGSEDTPASEIVSMYTQEEYERGNRHIRYNWLRCVQRALQHRWAEGIAYGYVGYRAS